MDGRKILAAAIQLSSTPNKGENLDTAERLIRSAASTGAGLIALPELWNCHGLEEVYKENAEPVPGPTTEFLARICHVHLLVSRAGDLQRCGLRTIAEATPGSTGCQPRHTVPG